MSYKGWVFVGVSLFAIGLLFGISTAGSVELLPGEQAAEIRRLADLLITLPQPSLSATIFIKNVSAISISFILSPLLCLVPILALLVNGWLVGLVSAMVLQEKTAGFLLAGLLPHGIFELAGFFIGEAAALSFGATAIVAIFRRGKVKMWPVLARSLKYLGIAYALLLVAAIVEAYATPLVLRLAT